MTDKEEIMSHVGITTMDQQTYLQEISQFCTYYTIIMDRILSSSSGYQNMGILTQEEDGDEIVSKDEINQVKAQLEKLHYMYLTNPQCSLDQFLDLMQQKIIGNMTTPSNLLRVAIRALNKVFDHMEPNQNLMISASKDGQEGEYYNPWPLLQSLMDCQLDDHSIKIDQQELILLNILKLMMSISDAYLNKLKINQAEELLQLKNVLKYFFGILDQRGFTFDVEKDQTIHFTEKAKKYMVKMLKIVFKAKERRSLALMCVMDLVDKSLAKKNEPIPLNENKQPVMTQLEKNKENDKYIKAIAFSVKAVEEMLLSIAKDQDEINAFIMENINALVKLVSLACEQQEEVVQICGQCLFRILMRQIFGSHLPLREQFEIMYVKCVLKPVIFRVKVLRKQLASKEDNKTEEPKADTHDLEGDVLSDDEAQNAEVRTQDTAKKGGPSSELGAESQFYELSYFETNRDSKLEIYISFLQEVLLSTNSKDIGTMFLVYDCQHFSESIITKSFNILLKYYQKNQACTEALFARLFQQFTSCCAQNESKIDSKQIHVTHQRLKYMIDQKCQQKDLARLCNIKPKLFLNKCEEIYKFIDEKAPWDIASKILLYSREVTVEHVTEIIGGKEARNKEIYQQFLDKQDFSDNDLLKSFRKSMQTFRLAGVESQCVQNVLEGFSQKFNEYDQKKMFVDAEEAYEMAYLMIVMQTTLHNPNIKMKLQARNFVLQAKDSCPKSYDNLPEGYMEETYNSILNTEFYSPLTRAWYETEVNEGDLNVCNIKNNSFRKVGSKKLDETEFVSSADITQKQIHEYNNEILAISDDDKDQFIFGSLRFIISLLTNKFLKMSQQRQAQAGEQVLSNILNTNKMLYNFDNTDRILRCAFKQDKLNNNLIVEIIRAAEMGAKNTISLIPQIIFRKGMVLNDKQSNINRFGKINKQELLQIFQATERFFKLQSLNKQISLQKQILKLEGKSPEQIDEIIKKQFQFGHPGIENPYSKEGTDQSDQSTYSLTNIVFNYFTAAADVQQEGGHSKITQLTRQKDQIKNNQLEVMKFMNKLFANLIKSAEIDGSQKEDSPQFFEYIDNKAAGIAIQLLGVLKENLNSVIGREDGMYCCMYLKNVIGMLIERSQESNGENEHQASLDVIWQELHIIVSKLTQTQRKIANLTRSASRAKEGSSSEHASEQNSDFDDLSQLDSQRSMDQSFEGISSADSGTQSSNLDKQVSNPSEGGSKVLSNYKDQNQNRNEKKVFQQMCRHMILDIFFYINRYQIDLISEKQSVESLQSTENLSTDIQSQQSKKDIQECMREIYRIFKSIIQGPSADGSFDKKDEEDSDEVKLDQNEVFENIQVIVCVNKLLQSERKIMVQVGDDQEQQSLLPISNYDKLPKLLRYLIIYSTQAIDQMQMEVFVQNSDSLIDVITICLKYIHLSTKNKKKLVPYELIVLIIDLIGKITTKNKAMRFDSDISVFQNIFTQIFDIIQIQNQFDMWHGAMKQYLQTVIYNQNLITASNWEQNAKHAFLIYKNATMNLVADDYGQQGSQIQVQNMIKMYEELYLTIKFDNLWPNLGLRQSELQDQTKMEKLRGICQFHLNNAADVLIQTLTLVFEEGQEFQQVDEMRQELFKHLWFNFLKMELNYVERMKILSKSVYENIHRLLDYLVNQTNVLQPSNPLLTKSFEVIHPFFPNLSKEFAQQ